MVKKDKVEVDTEQKILLMRAFTERTGALHEGQVLQLKVWPRIVFGRSTAAQSRINVEHKAITIEITMGKGEPGAVPEADQPKVLDEWVKTLLGPEWSVSIYVSEGKKKPQKHHFPGQEKKDVKPKE